MNPGNAPLVVGQLLDDECPEDFIKGLILSVRSLLPVEPLVDECEKRCCFLLYIYIFWFLLRSSILDAILLISSILHALSGFQKSIASAHSVFGASCERRKPRCTCAQCFG